MFYIVLHCCVYSGRKRLSRFSNDELKFFTFMSTFDRVWELLSRNWYTGSSTLLVIAQFCYVLIELIAASVVTVVPPTCRFQATHRRGVQGVPHSTYRLLLMLSTMRPYVNVSSTRSGWKAGSCTGWGGLKHLTLSLWLGRSKYDWVEPTFGVNYTSCW